ncbi:MAG: T9SS type A sorting domain-containing protein [Bacteroidia bacterium]|nr:T9SS type A sorting domain-containing protein [Bacteroidia bacterium]
MIKKIFFVFGIFSAIISFAQKSHLQKQVVSDAEQIIPAWHNIDLIGNKFILSMLPVDVKMDTITSPPASNLCDSVFTPVFVFTNNGTDTIASVNFFVSLDGNPVYTFPWTGTLPSLQTATVTTASLIAPVGTHTLNIIALSPNGAADGNPSDNSHHQYFTTVNGTVFPYPQSDDFEGGLFPKVNWTLENPDTNETWEITSTAGGYGNSINSIYFNNYDIPDDNSGQVDNYLSPFLDFSSVTQPIMTFDIAGVRYDADYYDSLIVFVTKDCGNTWSAPYAKGGSVLATAPDIGNFLYVPPPGDWRTDTVDLIYFAGYPSVQIKIQFYSLWGNATYIDNINFSENGVGIKENSASDLLFVYPNPAKENVTIKYSTSIKNGTLKISDTSGRLIVSQNCNAAGISDVDLSSFSAGIYFVEVLSLQGKVVRKLIID